MSDPGAESRRRKSEHLALCAGDAVDFREKSTLLEEVELAHDALPERALDEVELATELLGKRLRAPIVIGAMTGGTPEAGELNRDLARAAEELGLCFALGSQRAQSTDPGLAWTWSVRDVAPRALVLGNLGLVQAGALSTRAVRELCDAVGADALCLHLNAAMELIQERGDRDFRGGLETIVRLRAELGLPLVVKETGTGISRDVALRLCAAGVRTLDVAGAGGTSWVGVEATRAAGRAQRLGRELWDWGIPTAASLALLEGLELELIASGGLRNGLDVARALALGASAAGLAAPCLRAQRAGGYAGLVEYLEDVIEGLRAVILLCGCRRPAELRRAPRVLGPRLQAWIEQGRRASGR